MNIAFLSDPLSVITVSVLALLYLLEFVFKVILKKNWSLWLLILCMNTLIVVLFFILQIPVSEIMLVLMISSIVSLLLGKMRGGESDGI